MSDVPLRALRVVGKRAGSEQRRAGPTSEARKLLERGGGESDVLLLKKKAEELGFLRSA